MVVFDICSRESFANVPKWFTELERYAGENVARMIVGNKSDRAAERTVTEAEAKELADRMGLPYIECSAKTDAGVTESFTKLAKLAKDQAEADEMDD
jgi:GTPase SAR1 family protein